MNYNLRVQYNYNNWEKAETFKRNKVLTYGPTRKRSKTHAQHRLHSNWLSDPYRYPYWFVYMGKYFPCAIWNHFHGLPRNASDPFGRKIWDQFHSSQGDKLHAQSPFSSEICGSRIADLRRFHPTDLFAFWVARSWNLPCGFDQTFECTARIAFFPVSSKLHP